MEIMVIFQQFGPGKFPGTFPGKFGKSLERARFSPLRRPWPGKIAEIQNRKSENLLVNDSGFSVTR